MDEPWVWLGVPLALALGGAAWAWVAARLPAPPAAGPPVPMTTTRQDGAEADWLDVDLTDLRFKWDMPAPAPTPWTGALQAAYQRGKDRLPPDA